MAVGAALGIPQIPLSTLGAVLGFYQHCLTGEKSVSAWGYWWRGYFYNGSVSSDKKKATVALVDHLALKDQSYITDMQVACGQGDLEDAGTRSLFFDKVYLQFVAQRQQVHAYLTDSCDEALNSVVKENFDNHRLAQNKGAQLYFKPQVSRDKIALHSVIKTYFKKILNGEPYFDESFIREFAAAVQAHAPNVNPLPLLHDLKEIAAKKNAEKEKLFNELEKLKSKIDHLAWCYPDIHSKIAQVKDIKNECKLTQVKYTALNNENKVKVSYFAPKFQVVNDVDEINEYALGVATAKERYRKQKQNELIAVFAAFWIGLGEGFLAGVALFNYIFHAVRIIILWPIYLLCGFVFVCGFVCNYKLTKDDTAWMLGKFRFGNGFWGRDLFKNSAGEPISHWQVFFVLSIGVMGSLAAGIAYGFLQAGDNLAFFSPLVGLPAAWGIAALPALMTGLGFMGIFFAVISIFIIEEQYKDIYQYGCEFVFHIRMLAQQHKTYVGAASHIGLYIFGEIIKISMGLVFNAVVTYASSGMFHKFGVKGFQSIMKLNTANIASWIVSVITVGVNAVFCAQKAQKQISKVATLFSGDKTYSKALTHDTIPFDQVKLNPLQTKAQSVQFWTKASNAVCLAGNTGGMIALVSGEGSTPLAGTRTSHTVLLGLGQLPMSAAPVKEETDRQAEANNIKPTVEIQDFREKHQAKQDESMCRSSAFGVRAF